MSQLLADNLYGMGEWRVIDLRIGRASSREAGCTATAGVVPTRIIVRC